MLSRENGKESQSPPPEVIEKARSLLQEKMEANRKWVERYGDVYPADSTENFGKRLIAVRNNIYATDTRDYFCDFLRDYVVMYSATNGGEMKSLKQKPNAISSCNGGRKAYGT